LLKVDDINFFAQPDEVTQDELPREVDINPGLDDNARTKLCSKQSKQKSLEARWPRQTRSEEKALNQVPSREDKKRLTSIEPNRRIEFIKSCSR
jgi:hypothetical protein